MGTNAKESSINEVNQIKDKIANYINNSFDSSLSRFLYVNKVDIFRWKNTILNRLFKELDELIRNINELDLNNINNLNSLKNENLNDSKPKKDESTQTLNDSACKNFIKIENKNQLDFFTSKDIQDENKEITRLFQKEAYNYMNSEEEIENKNVAHFLKNVAEVSRESYSEVNILFKSLLEKFNKETNKNIITLDKEEDKKEFSSWVKKYEKNNSLQDDKNQESNTPNFLTDLKAKLKIMYFHCQLSFPSVEISFENEEKFNSEKMIDFINRGPKRKVNFVVLPSLLSNGNFLQNGKSWVFTYNKNTFKFEESEIKNLK